MDVPLCHTMRALEFYSGLGGALLLFRTVSLGIFRWKTCSPMQLYAAPAGMHYGLKLAWPNAEVLAAFDIDDVANDVYECNIGHRPHQVSIGEYPIDMKTVHFEHLVCHDRQLCTVQH